MQRYKVVSEVIIFILLLSLFIVFYNVELYSVGVDEGSGQDIYVDDDQIYPDDADGTLYNPFYSIQDALNVVQDGDTIKILPGTYSSDFTIEKSVTITTDNIEDILLVSSGQRAYMIDILADSVSLEDLKIHDSTPTSHRKAVIHISSNADNVKIVDCFINYSRNGYGLYIDVPTSSTVIKNNTFKDTRGIYIKDSNAVTIHGNHIYNCFNDPALKIVSSEGNYIEENIFENNRYGIYLSSSSYNTILDNTISSNTYSGIVISGGVNNTIMDNIITDNDNYGIELASSNGIISENKIYNNYIGIGIDGNDYNIFGNDIRSCSYLGIYAKSGTHNNRIYDNHLQPCFNGRNRSRVSLECNQRSSRCKRYGSYR